MSITDADARREMMIARGLDPKDRAAEAIDTAADMLDTIPMPKLSLIQRDTRTAMKRRCIEAMQKAVRAELKAELDALIPPTSEARTRCECVPFAMFVSAIHNLPSEHMRTASKGIRSLPAILDVASYSEGSEPILTS